MAGLIVSNAHQGLVGSIGKSGRREGGLVEFFDPLLIEVEHNPLRAQKVLPEDIVRASGAIGGVHHCNKNGTLFLFVHSAVDTFVLLQAFTTATSVMFTLCS
jgi:hypothetical protein